MMTIDNPDDVVSLNTTPSFTLTSAEGSNDPSNRTQFPPRPILVSSSQSSSSSFPSQGHSSRRSISGSDILNGLKIMTNIQHENTMPTSPVPSQLVADTHIFNNIDDFEMKEAIGYGSSAIVYSAIYRPFNKRVAIKIIDLDMFERNQIDELRRETSLMALSKHPNVLRVHGSFVNGSKLYIVTPYLTGGSCLDIMKTSYPEGLDEISIATILKQALEGIAYMHKNGHIHRDVKAGNLLMDEDGTVLLADFGVSSSLMETGERGMRKTFVGTPCWMAPEVMEQASYDYKADIWSFGITSIELATGHAPFAKHPPLKVLMMTLSNDPPTLSRETTKNKFSKTFKEMIDTCLNKDPTKRPSAERLLQHAFFRQAKKKDYLVKSLLAGLPSLDQRPRKKIPHRHVTITKTDEWDFNEDDDDDSQQTDQPAESIPPQKPPVKRHISFGDVVVRNPPQPSHASTTMTMTMQSTEMSAPTRKSRFVIEETSREYTDTMAQSSTRSASPSGYPELDARDESSDGEVKKGRFSVNHQLSRQPSSNEPLNVHFAEEPLERSLYKTTSQDNMADRKSRFEIVASASTTMPLPTVAPVPLHAMPHTVVPLSRENSMSSAGIPLAREMSTNSRSIARFAVDKEREREVENQPIQGESRKIGRFELTGGIVEMNQRTEKEAPLHPYESPLTTTSNPSLSSSPTSSLSRGQSLRLGVDPPAVPVIYSQLEELMRVNETQRQLLQEVCGTLNIGGAKHKAVEQRKASGPKHTSDGQELRSGEGVPSTLVSCIRVFSIFIIIVIIFDRILWNICCKCLSVKTHYYKRRMMLFA
ncbi:kinase-like domain-containing protein [Phycomyces nitens]|nr:kinase-like domain-containing protein [Phycomyces nitens]